MDNAYTDETIFLVIRWFMFENHEETDERFTSLGTSELQKDL